MAHFFSLSITDSFPSSFVLDRSAMPPGLQRKGFMKWVSCKHPKAQESLLTGAWFSSAMELWLQLVGCGWGLPFCCGPQWQIPTAHLCVPLCDVRCFSQDSLWPGLSSAWGSDHCRARVLGGAAMLWSPGIEPGERKERLELAGTSP